MRKLILLILFIPVLTPAVALTVDDILDSAPNISTYSNSDSFGLLELLDSLTDNEKDDEENTSSDYSANIQASPYISHYEYTKQLMFHSTLDLPTSTDIATIAKNIFSSSDDTQKVKKNLKNCFKVTFINPLAQGDNGADVLALQKFLNQNSKTRVSELGLGSRDNETEYYGALTVQAVKRFQELFKKDILESVGLTEPTGYFGPSTIKKANEITALCK